MSIPAESQWRSSEPGGSYSARYRTALTVSAFIIAILPAPVAGLSLLPVYRMHARFLIFYAPVVCLLILAYLHYVRGSLARLMFADLLRPQIHTDPYYQPSFGQSLAKVGGRVRNIILALLPVICMFLSFYCFTQYTARLNDSLDIAVVNQMQSQLPARETELKDANPKAQGKRGAIAQPRGDSALIARADSTATADPRTLRQDLLRTAEIDDIPLFGELTVLYIGAFAATLIAIILMALKEYAKTAMGLSERDVVLGPLSIEPND
jgi:hypothetical protein